MIAARLNLRELVALRPAGSRRGLPLSRRQGAMVESLQGRPTFVISRAPLLITAVDAMTRERVTLRRGFVWRAVAASLRSRDLDPSR